MYSLSTQEFRLAMTLLGKIIVRWDYDISLDEDGAVHKLPYPDMQRVIKTATDTIEAYVEGLDVEDRVTVEMDKWTFEEFYDFLDAGKANDVEEVERLMRIVCNIKGSSLGDRLTFEEGVLMNRAIIEENSKMFGKGE